MLVSLHNHTNWSDGHDTIQQTIEAARRLGIDHLGISDHLTLYPGGAPVPWSMDPKRVGDYIQQIRDTDSATLVGLEVDWFPDMREAISQCLDRHDLDYVIGSVHFIYGFHVDSKADYWADLPVSEREEKGRAYWTLIQSMAESGLYDIAAHLDLYKKFALCPDVSETPEAEAALDALARSGMAVEINTAGWFKACEDAYPSLSLLNKCRTRDIPLLLSSDSHMVDDLLRAFPEAAQRAREAGYETLCCFSRRERFDVPLP
ncbi:MAG: histidinol-phosphatase HisJ family protein [Planctomycetes bacterium]|nr:histidinol-phosphatase HisJ family protein [Planctomycetota bacterium]NOG54009.1 histidinol-phosphatase HisJ family protein [Planctomycetota bacterium]